jgi:hypothetical protein
MVIVVCVFKWQVKIFAIKILMVVFGCPLCALMNIMHRSRDRHRFCDSITSLQFNY